MNEEWRQTAIATGNAKWMSGINVVRMRYPQVLLMYAETLNELAGPDGSYAGAAGLTAREALAAVHTRAFDDAHKADAAAYVANIASDKDALFDAIVDENAWELAGEGFRKFDLIRWNLLSKKIDEFKAAYLEQYNSGVYPEKIYYNYTDEAKTTIDMSSVTWYETPEDTKAYDASTSFYGTYNKTQMETNFPTISAGLNAEVKNRYLMPIASTTISASNGKLHNSYGFSD
jgi:hypothetical protein